MAEAAKDFLTYLKNRQDGRLNLVAVGRTGDGKSSSLNSILKLCSANPILFKCYGGAVSITKACDERVVDVFGLNCRLVDTMGLFDTDFTTEQKKTASIMNVPDLMDDHKVVLMELSKVVSLCTDGVDAFLFVINGAGRFTQESRKTLEIIVRYFGAAMLDNCIVILTNKDHTDFSLRNIKTQMNEYLQKRGRRALEDGQFVAFDNKTIPAPREQVVQLFAAVEYLLIRTNGQAYQNDSFIVAKQELEKKKLLLLKERENQVKEMVEKEMEKIIRAHRAEAEELAQAILSREKELERLGTEQRTQRMEFQRQIESLKYQIENDKQTAQLEIQRAETEIRNESMAARNDQIRRLEFMLSGKPSAGLLESVAAAVGKMLDNWLSGCFPASVTVQTIRGPKKLDSLETNDLLITLSDDQNTTKTTTFIGHMEVHPNKLMDFLEISFANGNRLVTTGTHKVFVKATSGQTYDTNANQLVIGDQMFCLNPPNDSNATTTIVKSIKYVRELGIYNPLTSEGTLLVNGIYVSCYGQTIPAVVQYSHKNAHRVMRPMVFFFRLNPGRIFFDKLFSFYASVIISLNSMLGSIFAS